MLALCGEGRIDGETTRRKSRYAVGGVRGVRPPLVNDVADDGIGMLSLGLRCVLVVGVGRFPPAAKDVDGLWSAEGYVAERGVRKEVGRCLAVLRFMPAAIARAVWRLMGNEVSSLIPTIEGIDDVVEDCVARISNKQRSMQQGQGSGRSEGQKTNERSARGNDTLSAVDKKKKQKYPT